MIRDRMPAEAGTNIDERRLRSEGDYPSPPARRVRRLGRVIYLVLVIGFAIYLITALTGHLVSLKAAGLVTSDRFVVGAAYTARVVDVNVEAGAVVQAGQVIARLESTEVLTSIAQLAQNTASISGRRQELRQRQRIIESLMPVADERAANARRASEKVARDPKGLVISQAFRSDVLREAFDAERDLTTLQAEAASIDTELASLEASYAEVEAAIRRIRDSYGDGVVTAPVNGTVSATVAARGQVLRAGEPVMELLTGSQFVLAYLPGGRLFDVEPGERVVLTDGVRTVRGHVERIDMVADNLPPEFRTTFGVQERQQVLRVVAEEPMPFPFLSRVTVASPWSFTHLFAQLKSLLAGT